MSSSKIIDATLGLGECSPMAIPPRLTRSDIIAWLRETDAGRLAELWQWADFVRKKHVGDQVHLRGLVELSNYCVRLCGYCGLRAPNRQLQRYRMSHDEVMECVQKAVDFGYGTVVLQAGEDPALTCDRVAELVRQIKSESSLAVTLSLGERDRGELAAWRDAGADRYLLRYETSNRRLYEQIHPPAEKKRSADRIGILLSLRELGYEVGSGVMIGIPGQSYNDLADDVELFSALDLDMIGVGPYLAHPHTPLGERPNSPEINESEQAPATELMTYKMIALARLACPRSNIPATTALATLNTAEGRELGLSRGANVVMPNLTPPRYRVLYEIYPGKACIAETAEKCNGCLNGRIAALGRLPGEGRGDSPNLNWRKNVVEE
jgi:biotin synthase